MRGRHRTTRPSVALAAPDGCGNHPAHVRPLRQPAEAAARIFGMINPLPNQALTGQSRQPTHPAHYEVVGGAP
jgi:hypothetical protein